MRDPIDVAARAPGRYPIRKMTLDDLVEVMAIEHVAFRHPWSADLFRRELLHDWSAILVAEDPAQPPRQRIVGFIIFWLVHDEVHVLNVASHPEFRRQGVAKALLAEAEVRGRTTRAVLATLEVRRSNAAALALYRAVGYRPVGVRPNYYADDGEDAIVMIKELMPVR